MQLDHYPDLSPLEISRMMQVDGSIIYICRNGGDPASRPGSFVIPLLATLQLADDRAYSSRVIDYAWQYALEGPRPK